MGIFQSILDTPINSQFIPPPPVQLLPPKAAQPVPAGTPSPGTDAMMNAVGISPPGGAAPAAAPAAGAGGAAGAAGSNPGIMALIAQLLPMLGG